MANNRQKRHIPKNLDFAMIALGIVIMATTGTQRIQASFMTGQGELITAPDPAPIEMLAQGFVMPAAPSTGLNFGGQMAFGALLVLIGFGLHALLMMQNGERPVPVKVVQKKKVRKKSPEKRKKKREVILIERVIRI